MKISKILNFIASLIILIVVLVALPLTVPKMFDYQIYGILSGSMEPTYPVGSVIYVKGIDANEVKVGDPITFKMGADSKVVATHRVVEINTDNQEFVTKGDNNEHIDSTPVSFNRLLGKVEFCIPYFGYIAQYLETSNGLMIGVILIGIVFLLWFMADYLNKQDK